VKSVTAGSSLLLVQGGHRIDTLSRYAVARIVADLGKYPVADRILLIGRSPSEESATFKSDLSETPAGVLLISPKIATFEVLFSSRRLKPFGC